MMLRDKCKGAELLIRRTLAHNKKTYEELSRVIDEAYRFNCDSLGFEPDENMVNQIKAQTLRNIFFTPQCDMVSFFYSTGRKSTKAFATNIVNITEKATSPLLKELIEESNEWYCKIVSLKGV